MTKPRPRIAVLGMGNMGRALAARLLERGFQVSVWNRTPRSLAALAEAGAHELQSIASVWDVADIAIAFVANDEALREVTLPPRGILSAPVKDRLFIDMSTVSPTVSREIARAAAESGVDYLRSPVSGNPSVLTSGNLTMIVSGPTRAFERGRELLGEIGSTVLFVGEEEEARFVKLAINAGLAITTQLLAELVLLAERYGLDRATFLDVLGSSVLGSPFIKYKTRGLVERDYAATFTTALLAKDLRLALSLAADADLTLPVVELVSSLVESAAEGYADADFAALLPNLQRAHGHAPDLPPSDETAPLV